VTKFTYPGDLSETPGFFGAGDPDPHIPWGRVQELASVLSALGGAVTSRRYPRMPHTINQDEIEQAKQLLLQLAVQGGSVQNIHYLSVLLSCCTDTNDA
jgi:predicted esterase